MRKLFSRPFMPISVTFIIGIIFGKYLEIPFIFLACALVAVTLLLLVSKTKPLIFIFLVLVLLGTFRFQLSQVKSTTHISHFIDQLGQEKLEIQGKIVQEPSVKDDRISCVVSLGSLNGISVKGKIQLFINNQSNKNSVNYGDSILYRGSIFRADKNNNPFSFNYREYLENKHIDGISYVYGNDIEVTRSYRDLYYYTIIKPREWLRKRIDKYYSPRYAGFLKAILLGEKGTLSPKIRKDFAQSGLSHILAVSGLHTGVIALIILVVLQLFIRNRNIVRIFTILLLIYYMLLAHAVPSVQRAVIMISLLLLAKILQRKVDSLNILFGAAFIILVINPSQLFSVGFQLSFISVFSILAVFQSLSRMLNPLRGKSAFLFWLINLVLLSFIIQLILAPLTVHYFHTLAFGGIIANVIAIPLISLVLPLALLSILLPIPFFSVCYAASNKLLLYIVFSLSNIVSSHKVLFFDFLTLETFQIIAIYAVLISIILIWEVKDTLSKKLLKMSSGLVGCILILILPAILSPHVFQITFLDVGQGDAIVLHTPNNKTILVDTGDKTETRDYGDQVIVPYFKSEGIRSIDLLVLTHPHADHIGGALSVMENMEIDEVLIPKCEYESSLWENTLEKISEYHIPIIYADTSLSFDEFEPVEIKLLHPTNNYRNENNVNNYSVVLRCDYRDLSVLLTGDAEYEVEHMLMHDKTSMLNVDILKAGHHGSNTSSSEPFLKMVTPLYSIISVGEKNRYGHPDGEVVQRLEQYSRHVFMTDEDGAIVFTYGGNTLKIETIISEEEILDSDI